MTLDANECATFDSAMARQDGRCLICTGVSSHVATMPIDAISFAPTPWGVVQQCEDCGLRFIFPRPSVDQTAEFYRLERYYTHGTSHLSSAGQDFGSRMLTHLAWRVDHSEPLIAAIQRHFGGESVHICDVGCGGGQLAATLVRHGHTVVGVERDTAAMAFQSERFSVVRGGVEELSSLVGRERFDAAVLSHVLEHVVDPLAALREVHAILRPGGVLFCEVPNNASRFAKVLGLAWAQLDIPRHLTFFDPHSLRRAIDAAGLRFERHFFSGYCRAFSARWRQTEQHIHMRIAQATGAEPAWGAKPSDAGAWALLARTAFAAPGTKYDSVGVIAAKR